MPLVRFGLFGCAVLFFASCAAQPDPKPFPEATSRAEAALREVGTSLFEVASFRPEHHERQMLHDSYRREREIYRLRFVAEIRYLRDLHVHSQEETRERLRQPDATMKEIEQEIVWRRLLGAGIHAAGSTQTVRSAAVFEATEAGWRYIAIDDPDIEVH